MPQYHTLTVWPKRQRKRKWVSDKDDKDREQPPKKIYLERASNVFSSKALADFSRRKLAKHTDESLRQLVLTRNLIYRLAEDRYLSFSYQQLSSKDNSEEDCSDDHSNEEGSNTDHRDEEFSNTDFSNEESSDADHCNENSQTTDYQDQHGIDSVIDELNFTDSVSQSSLLLSDTFDFGDAFSETSGLLYDHKHMCDTVIWSPKICDICDTDLCTCLDGLSIISNNSANDLAFTDIFTPHVSRDSLLSNSPSNISHSYSHQNNGSGDCLLGFDLMDCSLFNFSDPNENVPSLMDSFDTGSVSQFPGPGLESFAHSTDLQQVQNQCNNFREDFQAAENDELLKCSAGML